MVKCSFCGHKLELGTGKMFVTTANKIFYFDSKRCEHYWNMGRNPKKFKWTTAYQKGK